MPGPDWIYHPLGALLALAGGWWLLWSFFLSGRARGKPRCPKCWYDMTGAKGLTCPECGKTPKSPKGLLRTRRKYFQALASLLVLLLAYSAWEVPRIKRYGWPCALPNWALIALYPIVDPPDRATRGQAMRRPIWRELRERLRYDRLSRIERIALSIIAGRWLDPMRPSLHVAEGIEIQFECAWATQRDVERLLEIECAGNDKRIQERAMIALAAIAILDARVQQRLFETWFGPEPFQLMVGDVLPRGVESDEVQQAWMKIVETRLREQDPRDAWVLAEIFSRIGPPAGQLLPELRRMTPSAAESWDSAVLVEAATDVVLGNATNEVESLARRLLSPDPGERAATAMLMRDCRSALTPEAVGCLAKAIDAETDDQAFDMLMYAVQYRNWECAPLLPRVRTAALQRKQARRWSSAAALAELYLEYPW